MKTIITIIIAIFCITLSAQKPSLDDRELLVQKEYSNEIYDSNPLFDFASIYVPKRSKLDFTNDSLSRISAFTPDLDIAIRPITYKTNQEVNGSRGFLKIDKGTINPLHAQAGYAYSAPNYFNVNGSLNYDYRSETVIENKFVKKLKINLGMEYYLTKEIKTEIALEFDKSNYGLYGSQNIFDQNTTVNNHNYNKVTANLGIQTFKSSPSQWNFGLHAKISEWKDQSSMNSERNVKAKGIVEFKINEMWALSVSPEHKFSDSKTFSDAHSSSGIFSIAYNTSSLYTNAGIGVHVIENQIQYWPELDMRWNVGMATDIDLHSKAWTIIRGAENITGINPYISTDLLVDQLKNTAFNRSFGLDVHSTISEDIELSFSVDYLKVNNDLNFKLNPGDVRTFDIELVNYEQLKIAAKIDQSFYEDQLRAGLALQYDNYARYTQRLYHRPSLSISPTVQGRLINQKLLLTLFGKINNPQDLDDLPALNIKSGWRKNISFEMAFKLSQHLNIYFNADNILDDEYQVWNGYNNFGRNLSGGMMLKIQ